VGAGLELSKWQHELGSWDGFICVPSWLILAIIGQSGGHCIEPASSGTHISIDRNGSRRVAARTPVETALYQKRMIYLYSQF
jgi:hypothetical protein